VKGDTVEADITDYGHTTTLQRDECSGNLSRRAERLSMQADSRQTQEDRLMKLCVLGFDAALVFMSS